VIVGLTSSSTYETLQGCGRQAEGMMIPTSYAPVNKEAIAAAEATAKYKGAADLHSMAAWENMFILKQVIESEGVQGTPASVQADRRRIRDGLAKLKATDGLLGKSLRTEDREADKPYLFVSAKAGQWQVFYVPENGR
jgi:branched-chain amino acid transport system substrate-binding protein